MGFFARAPMVCGTCSGPLGGEFVESDGLRFHGSLCFRRYEKTRRRQKTEVRRKEKNCGGCGTCGS